MKTFGNLLAFSPELWLLAGAIVCRPLPGIAKTIVSTPAVPFASVMA